MVPETEVETLVMWDSERILKESGNPRLNFNPGPNMVHTEIRHGTDILVPQNPLILGGESRKTAAAATTLHKTSTVQQEVGTKVPPLKEGKNEIKDNEDVFLVLPSYAEPFLATNSANHFC